MPMHNDKERFLQNILSHIKLPFDRKEIYNELANHIDDRIDDFIKEGFTREESTNKAIKAMGDATVIGKELNQMHNPLLGWLWKISDLFLKGISIIVILTILISIILSINLNPPLSYIEKNDIVYHLETSKQAKIDNTIIKITDLVYDTNRTLHIFFKTYSDSIFINSWSFGNIGTISDEFGNEYFGGSASSGGVVSYHMIQLNDFPESSNTVNIVYDNYSRYYEFHFNLPTGDENE